jgi:hypothetical protein
LDLFHLFLSFFGLQQIDRQDAVLERALDRVCVDIGSEISRNRPSLFLTRRSECALESAEGDT